MQKTSVFLMLGLSFLSADAMALDAKTLNVTVEGIGSDGYIDPDFAFCIKAEKQHVKEGHDKSVGITWSKGPEETKSYAIIMVDPDVPAVFDDAGKEGKTLPVTLQRRNFYHWILLDIPADKTSIPAYADSQAVAKKGKSEINTPYGMRGVNDYAPYFASDPERKGIYAGYDGPCPPWNDELVHSYHFKVFALDVKTLGLKGQIDGKTAMAVIGPHVIAEGEAIGKYSLK